MINAPFSAETGEEMIEIPFYSQPWFWDIVKQILGVLFILVLVFGVLRPVLNNITNAGKGSAGEGGDGIARAGSYVAGPEENVRRERCGLVNHSDSFVKRVRRRARAFL